jgi:hypothetical protein
MNAARTLIGNAFPLSLVRRKVVITPEREETLRTLLGVSRPASFWGHAITLQAASARVGADLTPGSERPALQLNAEHLPCLDGIAFTECWILSPEFDAGFRPAIGEEVPAERIRAWQVLKIVFE